MLCVTRPKREVGEGSTFGLKTPLILDVRISRKGVLPEKFHIQVSLVIRGRYVPSYWTANLEFADKKSIIFDWKSVISGHFSNVNKRIRR
jgi:hypothetical protein